jgi:hypothetical protein
MDGTTTLKAQAVLISTIARRYVPSGEALGGRWLIRRTESKWSPKLRIGEQSVRPGVCWKSIFERSQYSTAYSKSLLKSLSTNVKEHYPNASYGVYPTENDSKIAILVVANKYSPNNFW